MTDKAATYPQALSIADSGVLHRTGRYRTNGIERDHGFVKERLRPMRGLKSLLLQRRCSCAEPQYPAWLLPTHRVRSAAAGVRLDLERTRRPGVTRQEILG